MNKHIHSSQDTLQNIRALVESREYERAVEHILHFRRKIDSSSPDCAELYRLFGDSLYNLGEYRQALIKVKVAIVLAEKSNGLSEVVVSKRLLGRILVRLGRPLDAIEELTEAYVISKRIRDHTSIMLSLNALAQVHSLSGNLNRSEEVLQIALMKAKKAGDTYRIQVFGRNLVRIMLFTGDFLDARRILETELEKYSDDVSNAHVSLLFARLDLMSLSFESAEKRVSRAFTIFRDRQMSRDTTVSLEVFGLLEYNNGNYSQAREYYQQVLDMPEPTASAVAQTLRMLTDVCIAERNFDEAMATAKKAEKAITKINERIELGALYRAYG